MKTTEKKVADMCAALVRLSRRKKYSIEIQAEAFFRYIFNHGAGHAYDHGHDDGFYHGYDAGIRDAEKAIKGRK